MNTSNESMNDVSTSSANALMLHAERIVRPVRALQSRKLRMRTDLLAHLEAAVDEERGTGNALEDERAAVEHAKFRLGQPEELTKSLQQTVPVVERVLLAKIPFACGFSRFEERTAQVPGQSEPMTLGHKTILSVAANLACLPLLISMFSITTRGKPAENLAISFFFGTAGALSLLLLCYRFVFSAARPDRDFDWRGAVGRGTVILALQVGLALLIVFGISNRQASAGGAGGECGAECGFACACGDCGEVGWGVEKAV
ncbi:MAG: hypothetical protein ACREJD_16385 [Phycisphaerales bacterium]